DFNLNWIEFGKDLASSIESIGNENEIQIFYSTINQAIKIKSASLLNDDIVRVFDMKGQQVHQSKIEETAEKSISTNNWRNGIYFIQLSNSKRIWQSKLIVWK
nr:T9SS type A sorting domain-containing protein [Prolixibacteraceae bacterium]